MNPLIGILAGPLLEIGKELIDRVWPDKAAHEKERAAAELELLRLTQSERMADKANEVAVAMAQIKVNEEEAKNANVFVSGWRPFIGWTCGCAFLYAFLLGPLVTSIAAALGHSVPLPPIDMENMIYVLGGLLGLGGLRTIERVKGKA
jgi:hypothetical protein